jgi:non-heme chloroperoxidase
MSNTSSHAAVHAASGAVAVGRPAESKPVRSDPNGTTEGPQVAVPTLVMDSQDDPVVPCADSGPLSAKLSKKGTLKSCKGIPRGMPTTEAATINADLPAFFRG